jgi:hypothetical protein
VYEYIFILIFYVIPNPLFRKEINLYWIVTHTLFLAHRGRATEAGVRLSMPEETTAYQTSIQIFIIVVVNEHTDELQHIVCMLLVEEGLPLAGLALRVCSSLSVVIES